VVARPPRLGREPTVPLVHQLVDRPQRQQRPQLQRERSDAAEQRVREDDGVLPADEPQALLDRPPVALESPPRERVGLERAELLVALGVDGAGVLI
jgi:hypothetical protein